MRGRGGTGPSTPRWSHPLRRRQRAPQLRGAPSVSPLCRCADVEGIETSPARADWQQKRAAGHGRGREARMQPHGHGGARGCRRRCDSPAWITRAQARRVAVSQRSGGPHLRSARRRQRPRRGQPPTPETPCRRRRRRRRRPVGPPIEKKKPAQACRPEREAGICRSTSCIPRNRQYLVILA